MQGGIQNTTRGQQQTRAFSSYPREKERAFLFFLCSGRWGGTCYGIMSSLRLLLLHSYVAPYHCLLLIFNVSPFVDDDRASRQCIRKNEKERGWNGWAECVWYMCAMILSKTQPSNNRTIDFVITHPRHSKRFNSSSVCRSFFFSFFFSLSRLLVYLL